MNYWNISENHDLSLAFSGPNTSTVTHPDSQSYDCPFHSGDDAYVTDVFKSEITYTQIQREPNIYIYTYTVYLMMIPCSALHNHHVLSRAIVRYRPDSQTKTWLNDLGTGLCEQWCGWSEHLRPNSRQAVWPSSVARWDEINDPLGGLNFNIFQSHQTAVDFCGFLSYIFRFLDHKGVDSGPVLPPWWRSALRSVVLSKKGDKESRWEITGETFMDSPAVDPETEE